MIEQSDVVRLLAPQLLKQRHRLVHPAGDEVLRSHPSAEPRSRGGTASSRRSTDRPRPVRPARRRRARSRPPRCGRDGGRRCRAAASHSDRRDGPRARARARPPPPDPAIAAGRRAPGRADADTIARIDLARADERALGRVSVVAVEEPQPEPPVRGRVGRIRARSRGASRRSPRRCARCAPRRAPGDTTISAPSLANVVADRVGVARRLDDAVGLADHPEAAPSLRIARILREAVQGLARRRRDFGRDLSEAFNRRQIGELACAHATARNASMRADDHERGARRGWGLGAGGSVGLPPSRLRRFGRPRETGGSHDRC